MNTETKKLKRAYQKTSTKLSLKQWAQRARSAAVRALGVAWLTRKAS